MEKINSELDLYNRLLPALRTKKHELYRNNIKILQEKDIWLYNKYVNWKNVSGLCLSKMVDDILNTDDNAYYDFKVQKIREQDEKNGR